MYKRIFVYILFLQAEESMLECLEQMYEGKAALKSNTNAEIQPENKDLSTSKRIPVLDLVTYC